MEVAGAKLALPYTNPTSALIVEVYFLEIFALADTLRFLWDLLKVQILEAHFITADEKSEMRPSDLSSPKLSGDFMLEAADRGSSSECLL